MEDVILELGLHGVSVVAIAFMCLELACFTYTLLEAESEKRAVLRDGIETHRFETAQSGTSYTEEYLAGSASG